MEELIVYEGKVALAIAAFYIFYLIMFRHRKQFRFNRLYLSGSFILSFFIPLITITISQPIARQMVILPITGDDVSPVASDVPAGFDVLRLLFYGYLGVTALFFLRLLTGYIKAVFIIRKCRKSKLNGEMIYISREDIHPFTFFSKIVVAGSTLTHPDLEMILNHEKVHAGEKHTIDILLSEVFFLFQWFNPFAWLLKDAIKNNLEFLTDEEVVQQADMQVYQMAMVSLAGKRELTPFLNAFNGNDLKNRIIMMNKKTENKNKVTRRLAVLPVLVILILGLSNKEFMASPSPLSTRTMLNELNLMQNEDLQSSVSDTLKIKNKEIVVTGYATGKVNGNPENMRVDEDTSHVSTIVITGNPDSGNAGKPLTGEAERKEVRVIGYGMKTNGNSFKGDSITIRTTGKESGTQPLFILDGKEINTINNISPDRIESISVLKNESSTILYGEKGKNGVVIITSKKSGSPATEALVILDGKETTMKAIDVNPDNIQSINVLKGESAISKYGEKGKNGAIEITMKHPTGSNTSTISSTSELLKYIASSILYPVKAQAAGQQGTVHMYAFVNGEGKITQITESKPKADLVTVDEVVIVAYASKNDQEKIRKSATELNEEAALRVKNLPDLDIPEFKNRWVAFQFKFVLQ